MGNRVATVTDSLSIKIGGDPITKKAHKQNNRIKSTKYTVITFLPQNLLEQFRRIANFYFLVMTIITVVIDSPVSPLTSLIPLIFVIAVTAAKQGYEDFLRHRADNMVNFSLVTVIRNGCEEDIKCQEILQGDLVKAARDCDVPCDIVLLKSSDSSGKCHITTANLDGETNLKTLSVPRDLPNVSIEKLHTLGVIECEQPRTDLYTFNGRLELGPIYRRDRSSSMFNIVSEKTHALPLMTENLLLRGSRIKNTEWAIGCAVYTGQTTKLAINSRLTRNKMSSSEKCINKFLVFFLILLIAFVTMSYFLKRYYDTYHNLHNLYLGERVPNFQVSQFLQDYFSFLILFNYLIPISLYVTIEMHKFLGSFFMEWDPDLFDSDTNQPFIVNTSDLNEELGQVNILFSDKTGTLTKNEMKLQQCSINGKKYEFKESGIQQEGRPNIMKIREFREDVFNFFQTLSVCHTVQVAGSETNESKDSSNLSHGTARAEEDIQKTTSFNNIREENENTTTPDSDGDETDFIKKHISGHQLNSLSLGEYSPLLFHKNNNNHDDINFIGRQDSNEFLKKLGPPNEITASTKKFAFDNKIHPQRPLSLIEYPGSISPQLSPIIMKKTQLTRPLSIEFQRTISAIDGERQSHMTHRRTQSYTATTAHGQQNEHGSGSRSLNRQLSFLRKTGSVINMREYYAAPSFTEAALIERKESVRRKKDMNLVIENLDYQASSPDEKALVEACAKIGFLYVGEENNTMLIKLQSYYGAYTNQNLGGKEIRFERLHTLEFTSDRKRMSAIVKDRDGQIWLYTKGAESHVLPLCQATNRTLIAATQGHINDFAKIGLRTLAVARKKMTLEEYSTFNSELIVAANSLTDRKALIDEVQCKLENNLELLGATAVEDSLQDNVRDTLESLRYAGIRVWVLTGDKVETALNIALACGHIPDNAFKYFITECTDLDQLKEHFNVLEEEIKKHQYAEFSLLIDGGSLAIALKNLSERFRDLSVKCRAVLCCRLSPLQKCEVVHLMKTVSTKPITAAIGDGANDVSMIQEAHVGLGIVGKEGRQAARCADYALANFAMLKKVLLVHGHYYTQRLALLVLYFFYKNLVFMLIQLFFQINSMFSSQSVYDSFFLTLYNILFTSLPVLFISLTEKIYPEEELMKCPSLYKQNTKNKLLNWKYFVGWILIGCYHSVVIYVSGYIIWINNSAILTDPYTVNFYCFGTFMIHNVVVLVNLKVWLEAKYQSFWFIFIVLGSILTFMVTTVIYNVVNSNYDGDMLYVYNTLLSSLTVWLLFIVITVAAFVPDFTLKACKALNIRLGAVFPGNEISKTTIFFKRRNLESTYL